MVVLFVYIMASSLPTSNETGLGEVENGEVCSAICVRTLQKKKPPSKYTDEDRYKIANYASQPGVGVCQAAKHYKKRYPTISESTVRGFLKKYKEQLEVARRNDRSPEKRITNLPRGRPVLIGVLVEEKVRNFLMALHLKGGHISYDIAATTANVLLEKGEDNSLKNLNINVIYVDRRTGDGNCFPYGSI